MKLAFNNLIVRPVLHLVYLVVYGGSMNDRLVWLSAYAVVSINYIPNSE